MPQLQQIWQAFKKGKKKKKSILVLLSEHHIPLFIVFLVWNCIFFPSNAGEKETEQTRENFNKCFTPLILLTSLWEKLQP